MTSVEAPQLMFAEELRGGNEVPKVLKSGGWAEKTIVSSEAQDPG
jgi:hypothetical protein